MDFTGIDLGESLFGLDWVIQGGESGNSPRPFDVAWARQMRDRCRKEGVAYFLKQLGSNPNAEGEPLSFKDQHGGDWSEWPDDLRIREVPAATVPGKGRSEQPV